MGATFCNLYYHCEQTRIPEKYMPKSSRILSGLGDWTLLLTPDEPESRDLPDSPEESEQDGLF